MKSRKEKYWLIVFLVFGVAFGATIYMADSFMKSPYHLNYSAFNTFRVIAIFALLGCFSIFPFARFLLIKWDHYLLSCPKCLKNNSVRWIRKYKATTLYGASRYDSANDRMYAGSWTNYDGTLFDKCINCHYEFNETTFSGDDKDNGGIYDHAPVGSDIWEERYGIVYSEFNKYEYKT